MWKTARSSWDVVFNKTVAAPKTLLRPLNARFGHNLCGLWSLEPDIHFLNHGSFGATPHYVQAAPLRWHDEMEREPVRFIVDTLLDALRATAARLAGFVGASPSGLAFVENATAGVNAVLRSMRWQTGDRIVLANHAYPAVKNTVRFSCRAAWPYRSRKYRSR